MTHTATKWWLFGGVLLVAGLGIVLYQGYKAGTFVLFGQKSASNAQNPNLVQQYVPPNAGTCWTFESYTNQQFVSSTYESCVTTINWVGWVPSDRQMYSSFGQYNPTPARFNWDATNFICQLTNGTIIYNNLYECITGYKSEPTRWASHFNGGLINNPDVYQSDARANMPITYAPVDKAAQKNVIDQENTYGYCYGVTVDGGFEDRKYIGDCKTLYAQLQKDGSPETNVVLWCPVRDAPATCVAPPDWK